MSESSEELRPFAAQLSNVYFTILALFCCKLFIRITLNLLTHFYIIKGNRREAARISAEFYGQEHGSWADRFQFGKIKKNVVSYLYMSLSLCLSLTLSLSLCLSLTLSLSLSLLSLCLSLSVSLSPSQGHSVNALTIDHVSPLHEACVGNHVACARVLIDAGANCDVLCGVVLSGASVQRGRLMETPLHAAAQRDSLSITKLLLEFGADVNARNLSLKRPVEVASPGGLTEGFLLLYEATPRSLNQLCRQQIRECLGRTRLHLIPHLPLPTAVIKFLQYR
uniref:Ankyrin repeat and SOCS box containing 5a n=1 Tax=Astyanax mexicanus TaxID=7994 RepID=A0A3B1J0C3_ASTMX